MKLENLKLLAAMIETLVDIVDEEMEALDDEPGSQWDAYFLPGPNFAFFETFYADELGVGFDD